MNAQDKNQHKCDEVELGHIIVLYKSQISKLINMEKKLVVIILIIAICQTQRVSYHKRQLYFNQNQYVCMGGEPARKDLLLLGVNFIGSGKPALQCYADAGTSCSETAIKPWNQISPANDWDYYFQEQGKKNISRLRFNQTITAKYEGFLKKPVSMIATSVIINPTVVNDQLWNCQILGDGYVQKFGLYGKGRPCVMLIECKKLSELEQIKIQ